MEQKKILEELVEKLSEEKVLCFIFLLEDKNGKPKFIEVIVKRPYRYTEKGIMKRIPKSWKGIKIKKL
jgi:hypothetical protein